MLGLFVCQAFTHDVMVLLLLCRLRKNDPSQKVTEERIEHRTRGTSQLQVLLLSAFVVQYGRRNYKVYQGRAKWGWGKREIITSKISK